MKRKVGYTWKLREIMADQRIYTATELVTLLRERGIDLSASQVHRLVSGTLERLSLQVMSALCDILSCTPADLIAIPWWRYVRNSVSSPVAKGMATPRRKKNTAAIAPMIVSAAMGRALTCPPH
jgi:DNA-binding Xre family transcriptional regulator